LPVATAFGYATSVLHVYGIGAFILPLQHEFGWSRAFISSGLTIAGFVAAIFSMPLGILVDRAGARRVALGGVPLMTLGFALLGTTSGSAANWVALWTLISFANIGLQTTIWMKVISATFDTSRGLAIACTVCGASVAASLYPLLATFLIGRYGWRVAFVGMGVSWGLIVLPIMFAFLRTATQHVEVRAKAASRESAESQCRWSVLLRLALAGGIIAFMALGIIVHFVPILIDRGATAAAAAGITALIGMFSILGRIGTGALLDYLPGKIVGACACALPIIASLLLILAGDHSVAQAVAAGCFGLTIGAEIDVVTYLASRHFNGAQFGRRFGVINTALAVGTAIGPVASGLTFDRLGTYVPFLWLTVVLMAACGLALLSLPRPPAATSATA
jgi:MFS family permease